jgi:hypothetical protein
MIDHPHQRNGLRVPVLHSPSCPISRNRPGLLTIANALICSQLHNKYHSPDCFNPQQCLHTSQSPSLQSKTSLSDVNIASPKFSHPVIRTAGSLRSPAPKSLSKSLQRRVQTPRGGRQGRFFVVPVVYPDPAQRPEYCCGLPLLLPSASITDL